MVCCCEALSDDASDDTFAASDYRKVATLGLGRAYAFTMGFPLSCVLSHPGEKFVEAFRHEQRQRRDLSVARMTRPNKKRRRCDLYPCSHTVSSSRPSRARRMGGAVSAPILAIAVHPSQTGMQAVPPLGASERLPAV